MKNHDLLKILISLWAGVSLTKPKAFYPTSIFFLQPHSFLDSSLILYRYVKTFDSDYLILDLLSGKGDTFGNMLQDCDTFDWQKGTVNVVNREHLIQLKKMRNSEQDKVDILNLKQDEKEN